MGELTQTFAENPLPNHIGTGNTEVGHAGGSDFWTRMPVNGPISVSTLCNF